MSSAADVTVEQQGNTLAFIPENAETGLIFYPGGKVEYTAYAPLMHELDHLEVHPNNRILFAFRDGHVEEHFWKDHSRKDSWNTDKRKKAAEKTRAQHQRRRGRESQ